MFWQKMFLFGGLYFGYVKNIYYHCTSKNIIPFLYLNNIYTQVYNAWVGYNELFEKFVDFSWARREAGSTTKVMSVIESVASSGRVMIPDVVCRIYENQIF